MPFEIETVRSSLAPFFAKNPFSELKEEFTSGSKIITIQKPWNDDSIQISIPESYNDLIDSLNAVYLPPRLTAIWHEDSHDVEVIWTALPVPNGLEDVIKRSFDFEYRGIVYRCGFSRSSSRLMKIAEHSDSLHLSDTFGRNLGSFRRFIGKTSDPEDAAIFEGAIPLSFWVKNVLLPEDEFFDMIKNMNFYMSFYDAASPSIIVHPPSKSSTRHPPRVRYLHGVFPSKISALEIDANLLSYWEAARSGDAARRFAYYFRIIEYAASVYIDHSTRVQLRKLLNNPARGANLELNEDDIITTVQKLKADDYAKMESLIKDTLTPSLLWKEVSQNIPYFSTDIEFDGGFLLKKIVEKGCREQDFTVSAVVTFNKYIRDIRNALSHGKDQKTSTSILPTARNIENLRPWTSLIAIGAGEVMMFREVL